MGFRSLLNALRPRSRRTNAADYEQHPSLSPLSSILEGPSAIPSRPLDAPVSLGISINDKVQYDEEQPNRYIPLPPVTPTQESNSLSNYHYEPVPASSPHVMPDDHEESLLIAGNPTSLGSGPLILLQEPAGYEQRPPLSPLSLSGISEGSSAIPSRLLDPVSLGISINEELQYDEEQLIRHRTILLPPVTPIQETNSLSTYQYEPVPASSPQVIPDNHEGSLLFVGNPTSLGLGPSIITPNIAWEVPRHLQSVKNLKIENPISIGRFSKILRCCSRLEKLSVTINEDDSTRSVRSSGPVITERLIDLSIVTSVESKPLLCTFLAPHLKLLHLEWDDVRNNWDLTGLHLFLHNSPCCLDTLSLVGLFMDETKLVEVLKLPQCETIQTLVVRGNTSSTNSVGSVITDTTLNALAELHKGQFLCPNLAKLEIAPCRAPDGVLAAMMKTRQTGNTRPFSLFYSFGESQSLHPFDTLELEELRVAHRSNLTIMEGPQYCITLN